MPFWGARPATKNLRSYEVLDRPVTVVANHVTAQDVRALSRCLPGAKRFVVAEHSLPGLDITGLGEQDQVVVVDRSKPETIKGLLSAGLGGREHLVFFPEPRPSQRGVAGKLDTLAVQVALRLTGGRCLAVHLEPNRRGTRPVSLTCGNVAEAKEPQGLSGQAQSSWRESWLRRQMEEAMFMSFDTDVTLPALLVGRVGHFGRARPLYLQTIPERREINFGSMLVGCFALGSKLAAKSAKGERVGLMLPTAAGSAVVFHACQFGGVVPVLLNFRAGTANILSACETAQVKVVYTARALLERSEEAKEGAEAMREQGVEVVFLEDIRESLGLAEKLKALLFSFMPRLGLASAQGGQASPDDEAAVLFTSGSEGLPKGVVLSHRNIVANIAQILSRIDIRDDDLLFNSLPLFHSFGMIGGLAIPVAAGLKTLMFPSPLMYKEIPACIHAERATIIFSTSTFFAQYGKQAHPGDFESLRLIIAGGEQLKVGVRDMWLELFGKRILEGYGVTETSPALAVSTDLELREHHVGKLLPGISHNLEPLEGINEGGSLVVAGPNVMKGYLLASGPGKVVPPKDSRHDTGDVVVVDDEGFVRIVGRAKRFAKIAGEMVPLGRLEDVLSHASPDTPIAVVSRPDPRRGETLVFVTEKDGQELSELSDLVRDAGLPELWTPREVRVVRQIPLLPTGKVNYPELERALGLGGD